MARNVSLFQDERISTWTLKISLQIRTDEEDLDIFDREIVSSESIVLTAPAAGG
jgi:hypothetical protein